MVDENRPADSRLKGLLRHRWARGLTIAALVVLVIGFTLLESLRYVASQRGVESVALPPGSEIEALSVGADYVDAYRAPLPRPVPLDGIGQFVFQGGAEVSATPNEVVFRGGAPGLRFLISYVLTDPGPGQSLTVSTSVFYESLVGRLYFAPVQQVHKRGVPFVVSTTVRDGLGSGG